MNLEGAKARIKAAEGFSASVYVCPANYLTIGWGHKLTEEDDFVEGVEYDKDELELLFEKDFNIAYKDACSICEEYNLDISDTAKEILIDMAFNLGKPRLLKFKKMLTHLQNKQYDKAADEIINSKYFNQVGKRASNNANLMRTIPNVTSA